MSENGINNCNIYDCNCGNCCDGMCCNMSQGIIGPAGPQGPAGPPGEPGGLLGFADFYALMPPDNSATVAPGADVAFPRDGVNSSTDISRISGTSFNLSATGIYQVLFQVDVTQAGQLILTLNGTPLDYTAVGRATGTTQLLGICLIETTAANSVLTVQNPADNPTALTITPSDGGTQPVSAHLLITRLQ